MNKVKIGIICFFRFLGWMIKHPLNPKENWQDMISCYHWSTDKEMIELTKQLEDKNIFNNN